MQCWKIWDGLGVRLLHVYSVYERVHLNVHVWRLYICSEIPPKNFSFSKSFGSTWYSHVIPWGSVLFLLRQQYLSTLVYRLFLTCPQVLLSYYSWLPRADVGEAHVSETLREVHYLHGGLCRDSQPGHHCTPRERVPPKVWVDIFCALPQASTLTSHRQFKVV